ncbi:hypothetical protein QR680_009517 [Steinernema hermaphroditum]|uniref:Uncharacterized protein n=1 Tax=Steinernema hermaphroditum TaxID=289476 RepID=A0AA39IKJ2_9BILA|nr:hypothetical protein QR680_009517 [Steinernema hermaphroditum]
MPPERCSGAEHTEPLMGAPAHKEFAPSILLESEDSMKTTDEALKAPLRTCCFCVDVRPATALLMLLEVTFFAALLFTGLVNLSNTTTDASTVPFVGLLLCYAVSLAGAVLVLYGVFAAKPLLLIPYLVKQMFTITLTLLFIYKAIAIYFGHYSVAVFAVFRQLYESDTVVTGMDKFEDIRHSSRPLDFSFSSPSAARHLGGVLLLGGCLALCIEIFATDTVRKCYQYFREKSRLVSSGARKA